MILDETTDHMHDMALDVMAVSQGCGLACAWGGDRWEDLKTVHARTFNRTTFHLQPAARQCTGEAARCSPTHSSCCHVGPQVAGLVIQHKP